MARSSAPGHRVAKSLDAKGLDVSRLADPELAAAAAAGERSAFEELYRRNVPAAWRVAQAVATNRDDASDAVADAFERVFRAVAAGKLSESRAFRPYLLTATRRAAIDISRRSGRVAPTDEIERLDTVASLDGPPDKVMAGLEATLVARAFRDLPERWRSVLWLTEVERLSAQDAATVLKLTPNNVAQLAVRARVGLRKRYLEAHVRNGVRPQCQPVIERLSPYMEGRLGHRPAARVAMHLTACAACRGRREELRDLGLNIRRSALPLPVALGAAAAERWYRAASVQPSGSRAWVTSLRELPAHLGGRRGVLEWVFDLAPQLTAGGAPAIERAVSWATASVLVLGVSAGIVRTGAVAPGTSTPPPAAAAVAAEPLPGAGGPVAAAEALSAPAEVAGGAGNPSSGPAPPAPPPGATVAAKGGAHPAATGATPTTGGLPLDAVQSSLPAVPAVTGILPPAGGATQTLLAPLTGGTSLPIRAPGVNAPVNILPTGTAVGPLVPSVLTQPAQALEQLPVPIVGDPGAVPPKG